MEENNNMEEKNLEIKVKATIDDFTFILNSPIEKYYSRTFEQIDTYFVIPDGRLKKREEEGQNTHFIRYFRPDLSSVKPSCYTKYYIGDVDAFDRVFGSLLKREVIVNKSRKLFLYKNARIHLDMIRNLSEKDSFYIEIEVIIKNKKDEEKSTALMNELLIMMNLTDKNRTPLINNSYREIVLDHYNKSAKLFKEQVKKAAELANSESLDKIIKQANKYKVEEKWEAAGTLFINAAELYLKLKKNKYEAALSFTEAANMFLQVKSVVNTGRMNDIILNVLII